MYGQDENQYPEQDQKKHSAAKAAVAQAKPRDDKGHFLSGAELQNYQAQRQAQQLSAERDRMNTLLGNNKGFAPNQPSPLGLPAQQDPQDRFRALLKSNTMGKGNSTESPSDKWDTLLGKKKSNIRW